MAFLLPIYMSKLYLSDIAKLRLSSQQLSGTKHKTVKELVYFMGAMQAQDYPMAKWAVGSRLPGSRDAQIEESINRGEVVRSHLLRPTWHLAAAEDVKWMLELSAPQIKTLMGSMNRKLELNAEVFSKSNKIFEKELNGGKHLTRDELTKKLTAAKIDTKNTRGIHIFMQAEMDGILCGGSIKDKKTTYAFLPDRLPKTKSISKEEALAKLAQRYFSSHSPATFKDFYWWSGLPVADAKKGLEAIKKDFLEERVGKELYYLDPSVKLSKSTKNVHLLPAFDEYLISYKSRHVSIHGDHQPKAFTTNGIFKPLIVVDGQVTGIWKRTMKKNKVIIEPEFFQKSKSAVKTELEKEVEAYGKFLGLETELKTS